MPTKLSLPDVTFAVVTPVPAISMKTFWFAIEVEGPTSSNVKSKELIDAPCAITIPPSANDAAAVSPSVMLSNVTDCPAPTVIVMVDPSIVVPEASSTPLRLLIG